MDIALEILEFEELFAYNNYSGKGEDIFMIEKGDIPIILSAPHAICHYRNGNYKAQDKYTGGIVKYLHKKTNCHIIYSSKYYDYDPNYDLIESNPYQRALCKYIKENDIRFLLDIHGASKDRDYAIEICTIPIYNEGGVIIEDDTSLKDKDKLVVEEIKNILHNKLNNFEEIHRIAKNEVFNGDGGKNTIIKQISRNTEASCIEFEINRKMRDPNDSERLESLIQVFIEIIEYLKEISRNT